MKFVLADFRRLNADSRRTLYDCSYQIMLFNKDTDLICENLRKISVNLREKINW